MSNEGPESLRPRSIATLIVFAAAFAFAFGGFLMLGVWQLERRAWKLDLIERVDARVHATPVAAPAPNAWPLISAARDEYRRIQLAGHFLSGKDTRVQAVTALGGGFWLLTPFQADAGFIVLINRGFVPPQWQDETQPPAVTSVTGLLRLSENKGGFLRRNEPAAERWYARDVDAIATARGLQHVAPYFLDMENNDEKNIEAESQTVFPRGGLTVIHFSNNHLGYALTWFGLALMVGVAGAYLVREEYRARQAYRSRRASH